MSKRRRSQGTGSVYYDAQRKRWIGEVTLGGQRRRVVVPGTKGDRIAAGEAKRKLRELIDGLDAVTDDPAATVDETVGDVVDTFLRRELPARRRGSPPRPLAPATVAGYRWACDLIVEQLGPIPVAELRVGHVESFYDELVTDGGVDASASLRKIRTTLHQVLAIADRHHGIRNVAAVAKLPPAADARPRHALKPDEARQLLEQLRHEPYGLMFAFSLRLGLRPGEAAAIAWGDIEGDVLHVRRGRRAVGGKMEVANELKTEASRRTIELPADFVEWVAEHRAATFNVAALQPGVFDDVLMFPSPRAQVLDPSNMRRLLADICERAGVPTMRPVELRHSCASLLSDEGVPHQSIADLLGHTTSRMVDAHYRHRLHPVVDVAAQASWASETVAQ